MSTIGNTKEPEITTGTDPEFIVLDTRNKRVVEIGNYIGQGPQRFGRENQQVVEIRPSGYSKPHDLCKDFKDIMRKDSPTGLHLEYMVWLAGACIQGHSLGGHIHLAWQGGHYPNIDQATLHKKVGLMLDIFVGFPLRGLDDRNENRNRLSKPYGQLYVESRECIRHQASPPYPREYAGIEYRAPSSKMLQYPLVMRAVHHILRAVGIAISTDENLLTTRYIKHYLEYLSTYLYEVRWENIPSRTHAGLDIKIPAGWIKIDDKRMVRENLPQDNTLEEECILYAQDKMIGYLTKLGRTKRTINLVKWFYHLCNEKRNNPDDSIDLKKVYKIQGIKPDENSKPLTLDRVLALIEEEVERALSNINRR